MEFFQTWVFPLLTSLAMVVWGAVVNRRVRNADDRAKEEREKKRLEEDRVKEEQRNIQQYQATVARATRALLRDNIYEHAKMYIERGHATLDDKRYIERLYALYHSLGGNGTVTSIYDDVMELPTTDRRTT